MPVRLDYRDSGLSTLDAVKSFEDDVAKQPRLLRFLYRLRIMSVACDGIDATGNDCKKRGRINGKLTEGVWGKSRGWVHRADLDFCPTCQKDGGMDRAIAQGVRPRGAV